LDYGCGEAAVLSYLIPENDHTITKMAGIDICDQVLVEAIDRCTPWKTDFEQLRNHPLIIDIFKGSIGEPDDRFLGFEGIICTEVIEHVYTPVLDSFLDITLGLYQPRILVVTTPNGEYNVNFPDLKYGTDESTFRHNDHKFEWTRKEFKDW
jgi:2-polyprenyl-3-methyl-5-hydroxy-6-metoxy-1,4-benzoquinol methylase